MKLAFYYHIPLHIKNGQLFVPGFLGVFIDELAKNVDHLTLVMHLAKENEITESDYKINSTNITFVSLGKKTTVWHRSLFPRYILKNKLKKIESCDAFLVRAPSPLASSFHRFIKHPKLLYMIVGDYAAGAKQIGKKGMKNKLLHFYFNFIDKQLKARFPYTDLFVNSPELFERYKSDAKSIELIKTTTLQDSDYFEKDVSCLDSPIQLLYTGRIEFSKGLIELVEATSELIHQGFAIHLNFVGWENNIQNPVENTLIKLAKDLQIEKYITFHGRKKTGAELNTMYQNASLYVIPSHYEGFPRTIWEAMANSCPVIATKVGAIPFYLKDEQNALLIEPKSKDEIKFSIVRLVQNNELRQSLVKNAFELSKEVSLKKQTAYMIKLIREKI